VAHVTAQSIQRLAALPDREVFLWDSSLRGFGVRVTPAGLRSFIVQYRIGRRTRRMRIGRVGEISAADARKLAAEQLATVRMGGDPSADRRRMRESATVEQLTERYLHEHAEPKKRPSSVASDRRLLERCVLPRLGKFRVVDLSRADVVHFHHAPRATPIQANRALSLLSKILNLAELWGLRADGTNPCRHVQRYRERRFERFLSEREFQRLGVSIAELQSSREISAAVAGAVRVLMFSGARRGEICRLRWEQVDTEHACVRLPDSKTGAKTIPLSAKALEVIAGLRRRSPWVFPTEEGGQPVDLSRPWERIRERAGLATLRIHDLRHSHASVLAGAGVPLLVIGRILGHATPTTTARNAHLADHAVRSATELASERIAAAIAKGT